MDSWDRQKKHEIMSLTAKARWAKMTPEKKKEWAMKMVEARQKRSAFATLE